MQNIILLHGALGSGMDLETIGSSLKKHGCHIHPFLFSGHGAKSFQPDFGIEQFSLELEQYIHQAGIKPVHIFGYSMGGFVALHLAAKKHDLISKIITLGTKFNWSKEVVEKETASLDPDRMLEKIPAFAKSLEQKHGANWKETVYKTAFLMKEIGEKQFLSPDVLKRISIPVLLGLGDNDKMVTVEETRDTFKMLPHADMYMLPGTKHPVETANTELLSRLIVDFISKA